MKNPWESDSCEAVRAYFTIYPVPFAAALWCGIPANEVEEHLRISTEVLSGVYRHPYIPCLEPRCMAIHDAIVKGALDASRENGAVTRDHIAPARRHVSRENLKNWIAIAFPGDRPAFLFDELERSTHKTITVETVQALQAERDALKARLAKAEALRSEAIAEKNALIGERDSLRAMVDKMSTPGARAETTYLNIIGGLLGLMLGKSPAGNPQSVYENQGAIISALLAHYPDKPGIKERTLQDKFPEAKRSLEGI